MRLVRRILIALALVVVSMPVAIVVTFLLIPLWRWIEERWQIESIGHSGPADWCFVAIYALILALAFATWWRFARRSKRRASAPDPISDSPPRPR